MMRRIGAAVRNIPGVVQAFRSKQLEALRSRVDLDPAVVESFQTDRTSEAYLAVYVDPEPLVSVCIGTYNRARLLTERTLPSILSQDYTRLEVIVVGDACVDDTGDRIRALGDARVRFVNLPQRGLYPADPGLRWMVAGTVPFNHAMQLAAGSFVTHLDDDDEYVPGRIGKLVQFIQQTRADLVWHPFWAEVAPDEWRLRECREFARMQVTTSSVFYHRWFARIGWNLQAHRLREPGDWNRFRKLKALGASVARYPEPLLRHFRERTQSSPVASGSNDSKLSK